jgi:hypothetical protein
VNRHELLNYSDILRDLESFDDWLRRLGVPVRCADRAHYALKKLRKAHEAFLNHPAQAEGISKADYLFGLTEAVELHDVYRAFKNHPPEQLRDRLARALSGPLLPDRETAKNRDARNVMFELALGAEWALCGGEIQLIEPDLMLRMPERRYFVACKRPERDQGIRPAVRDAASQLRATLSAASPNHFGIIAISLSHILNPGNAYFSGTYEQLSNLLNGLMSVHRPKWRTTDFHPQNIAVIFYAHTPADWGAGLYRLSAMRVGPTLLEHEAHRNLRHDLRCLYPGRLQPFKI